MMSILVYFDMGCQVDIFCLHNVIYNYKIWSPFNTICHIKFRPVMDYKIMKTRILSSAHIIFSM